MERNDVAASDLADAATTLEDSPINAHEPVTALHPMHMRRLRKGGAPGAVGSACATILGRHVQSGEEASSAARGETATRQRTRREGREGDGASTRRGGAHRVSSVSHVCGRCTHLARLGLDDHVVGGTGEAKAPRAALERQGEGCRIIVPLGDFHVRRVRVVEHLGDGWRTALFGFMQSPRQVRTVAPVE